MIFGKKKKPMLTSDIPKTRADVQLEQKVDILYDANANFTRTLELYLAGVRGDKK